MSGWMGGWTGDECEEWTLSPPHLVIIINIILLEVEKRRGKSGRAVDLPRRKSALTYVTSPRLAGTRSRDPHEIRVGPPNPLGTRPHRPTRSS